MILTAVAILDEPGRQLRPVRRRSTSPTSTSRRRSSAQSTVTGRLHQITGHEPKFAPANGSSACGSSATKVHAGRGQRQPGDPARGRKALPALGAAPEFTETQDWFNTPGDRPLSLASLRGTGGAGGLLDLHLHQLHPHAAVSEGVGCRLPQERPHDRRRRDARVRLRARRLATSPTRSISSACTIRWSRTTTWAPGTPTATSTGRPTT